jgi:hypothetical protein
MSGRNEAVASMNGPAKPVGFAGHAHKFANFIERSSTLGIEDL